MPTPAQKRSACYAMIALARAEPDKAVRRILAARAFALAQEAQLQAWAEDPPRRRAPAQA